MRKKSPPSYGTCSHCQSEFQKRGCTDKYCGILCRQMALNTQANLRWTQKVHAKRRRRCIPELKACNRISILGVQL